MGICVPSSSFARPQRFGAEDASKDWYRLNGEHDPLEWYSVYVF